MLALRDVIGVRDDLVEDRHARDGLPVGLTRLGRIDDFAKPDRIEGFRIFSVRELAKHRSHLRDELDRFAQARRHQVAEWSNVDTPSVLDAAAAAIDAVSDSALKAVGAACGGCLTPLPWRTSG